MKKKYLLAKEVADLIKVPMVTVLRWAHQGKIPSKRKNDVYFFRRSEIISWAKGHDLSVAESRTEPGSRQGREGISLWAAMEKGGIHHDLPGGDLYTVLSNALDLCPIPPAARAEVLNELLNREEIASTGIGKGVAIPHPRRPLEGFTQADTMIPVFFLQQSIDFNSVDGDPVFVLFLMFSPSTQVHLQLLSRLSFCLRDREFMDMLQNRQGRDLLLSRVAEIENDFDRG